MRVAFQPWLCLSSTYVRGLSASGRSGFIVEERSIVAEPKGYVSVCNIPNGRLLSDRSANGKGRVSALDIRSAHIETVWASSVPH